GAGDLVVPALLLRVECRPDHTDEERDTGDEEPDVAEERADEVELRAVCLHDSDVERAHPNGLSLAVARPEVAEIDHTEQCVEAASRGLVPLVQDRVQDRPDDAETDEVDEDREETRPPTGFFGRGCHRHGRCRHVCFQPPSWRRTIRRMANLLGPSSHCWRYVTARTLTFHRV